MKKLCCFAICLLMMFQLAACEEGSINHDTNSSEKQQESPKSEKLDDFSIVGKWGLADEPGYFIFNKDGSATAYHIPDGEYVGENFSYEIKDGNLIFYIEGGDKPVYAKLNIYDYRGFNEIYLDVEDRFGMTLLRPEDVADAWDNVSVNGQWIDDENYIHLGEDGRFSMMYGGNLMEGIYTYTVTTLYHFQEQISYSRAKVSLYPDDNEALYSIDYFIQSLDGKCYLVYNYTYWKSDYEGEMTYFTGLFQKAL